MSTASAEIIRIAERSPAMSAAELAGNLVPPPHFRHATFENYRPDPAESSQQAALDALRAFADGGSGGGRFGRRRHDPAMRPGVYLDGGFGVGKTHLLAALWHAVSGPKHFGTFIEYTALVGALGFRETVALLRPSRLICIDEFELDDPGDTMLMSRLLGELVDGGTRLAATSNTPPNALGEGRFAASDFLREIHGLAARFEVHRIEGQDYRQRHIAEGAAAVPEDELAQRLAGFGGTVSLDDFDALLAQLARVHPSRYVKLLSGLQALGLQGVRLLEQQTDALRLVAFVDRAYDAQLPIVAAGLPLDRVFAEDMLTGGYRKKYLRAISRLVALTALGAAGQR